MFTMEIRVPSCGLASQPPSARPRDLTLRLKITFWVARVCGSTKLCGTNIDGVQNYPTEGMWPALTHVLRLKTM